MNSRLAQRPPRVGLVGLYGQGLFADDLMGVIFGLFLRRLGVPFSVYKLCKPYAEAFGFTVAHSVEELLEDAQALLWGGGGLLVPWSNLVYNLVYPHLEADYSRLIAATRAKGIPMYAFSVGGSGEYPRKLTPSYKQSFLESAEYISVRNREDLPLLQRRESTETAFRTSSGKRHLSFPPSASQVRRCGSGWISMPENC